MSDGPRVVALGGGHGLAATLRAARIYAGEVTAVVTVGDDGGSSGRLRRDLGVAAPGDLRKALGALAGDAGPWADAFEYRFTSGEPAGHALGNLVLVGLASTTGDLGAAVRAAGRLLDAGGVVLPATSDPVAITARLRGGDTDDATVVGQVAVSAAGATVAHVGIEPADARPAPGVVEAVAAADQVVLAPGSLYTSVLAVLCVPEIADAVRACPGRVVHVLDLRPEEPETSGLGGDDHVQALLDHGVRVDAVLAATDGELTVTESALAGRGIDLVRAPVAVPGGTAHDAEGLAKALSALL